MAFSVQCMLLYLHCIFICCLALHHGDIKETKVLNVGEELQKETLSLKMGGRIYHVHGLKESKWYEVKISYPASVPAVFSIVLERNVPLSLLKKNRRLLNTERAIFEYDSHNLDSGQSGIYVLVTVEPVGVVAAKKQVHEREVVLFNIVCDELIFGIPHKAWWVGIAAILCLVLALAVVVPCVVPSLELLLLKNQNPQSNGKSS